ncbi:hypothetical protein JCM11957_06360 [Caminibacter profundus]
MIQIIGIGLLIINLIAKEYFISFEIISKNNKIIYSKINCSKNLLHKNFSKKKYLFSIKCQTKDFLKCCQLKKDKIINKLILTDISISGYDEKSYSTFISISKLIYLPHLFDIIIKDDKAYFYIKEKD